MKKFVLAAVLAASTAVPALAADLMVTKARPALVPVVSPFDIAFGSSIASDYRFRGISQSSLGPSVNAYFEPRWNINPNLQIYGGVSAYSVELPSTPAAEIDVYAGIRPTFGALALDLGALYYYYPREKQFGVVNFYNNGATTLANTDFLEFYAKGTYTFTDALSVGLGVYYSDNYLNTRADGTYVSGNAKYILPGSFNWFNLSSDWGAYVSGELSYYDLGTTRADGVAFMVPTKLPDYTTWNVGLALTYKVFTLDLRYHDTDLTREQCFGLTGDPTASFGVNGNRSAWCGSTFVAKLAVDLTLASLK